MVVLLDKRSSPEVWPPHSLRASAGGASGGHLAQVLTKCEDFFARFGKERASDQAFQIVCVGRNYATMPGSWVTRFPTPMLFFKPPVPLSVRARRLCCPRFLQVEYESEIGVIIGRTLSHASESEPSVRSGAHLRHDVTARDLQKPMASGPGQGFDTFCPFGPTVAQGLDWNAGSDRRLNGVEPSGEGRSRDSSRFPSCSPTHQISDWSRGTW